MNLKFSFSKTGCHTNVQELTLPFYIPIAEWRMICFVSLQWVLTLCVMQTPSTRTWTRVAVSISHDSYYYTSSVHDIYRYIYTHTQTHTHTHIYTYINVHVFCMYSRVFVHWPNEYSVRQWSGRPRLNPRSSHTKDSKNGTWCRLA